MNTEKLLTILIPTYNAESYLEKCLASFLLKDPELFQRLEVLVVNDGSPDGSRTIAEKYVEKYPTVYGILDKENGGHGSAINAGVKQAAGLYFKVIDADDWVDQEGFTAFMQKLSKIAEEKPDVLPEVLATPYLRYDIGSGKTEERRAEPKKFDRNYTLGEVMDQWNACHEVMHFWGITYQTSFYRSLHYELAEGVFYEDQEYATVPASYGTRVRFLDTLVYVYRVGDVNQSVFGDTQVKRRAHLEKVIERLLAQYGYQKEMPGGADRYYRKKTAMVITSYYQIMLLKNKDKRLGRDAVTKLNQMLKGKAPAIYQMTEKKCKGFLLFSYLHISNSAYELWAPKAIGMVRRIRGQRV